MGLCDGFSFFLLFYVFFFFLLLDSTVLFYILYSTLFYSTLLYSILIYSIPLLYNLFYFTNILYFIPSWSISCSILLYHILYDTVFYFSLHLILPILFHYALLYDWLGLHFIILWCTLFLLYPTFHHILFHSFEIVLFGFPLFCIYFLILLHSTTYLIVFYFTTLYPPLNSILLHTPVNSIDILFFNSILLYNTLCYTLLFYTHHTLFYSTNALF